jgi:HSP20 family protein
MVDMKQAFDEFERLHEQMEQMWRRMIAGVPGAPGFCVPVIQPPTDIFETPNHVVIVAEVAGIEEEQVEMEMEGDRLTFRGEKSDRRAEPHHRHAQVEICYGHFERTVTLPVPVKAEGIEVSYSDGFLRIVLPKEERRAPREVKVTIRRSED